MSEKIKHLIKRLSDEIDQLVKQRAYEQAIPLAEDFCNQTAIHFKLNAPEYTDSVKTLAELYKLVGNFSKADETFLELADLTCLNFGKNHTRYASVLMDLADLYVEMKKYRKAEPLFQQALEIYYKRLGGKNEKYKKALRKVENFYQILDESSKQPQIHTEVETESKSNEKDIKSNLPPGIIQLASNVWKYFQKKFWAFRIRGEIYGIRKLYNAGNYEEALISALNNEEFARECCENHPVYADSLDILARIFSKMERNEIAEIFHKFDYYYFREHGIAQFYQYDGYKLAEYYYRSATLVLQELLGDTHADYVESVENFASFYLQNFNLEDAESQYRVCIDIVKNALNEKYHNYHTILSNLGLICHHKGNLAESEYLLRKAAQVALKTLGKKDLNYAVILSNLGDTYFSIGKFQEAETHFHKSADICRKAPGESGKYSFAQNNRLALVYIAMGNHKKSETLLYEGLEHARSIFGDKTTQYALALLNIASFLDKIGKFKDAEEFCSDALKIYRDAAEYDALDYDESELNQKYSEPHIIETTSGHRFIHTPITFEKDTNFKKQGFETATSSAYAGILNNLATYLGKQGHFQKALQISKEALETSQSCLDDKDTRLIAPLINLASLSAATNQTEKIVDLIQKITEIQNHLIWKIFSMSSEKHRLEFFSQVRPIQQINLSLLLNSVGKSDTSRRIALEIVLLSKAITAEALIAQRDAVLSGKNPHLEQQLRELSKLREQIALKTLAGPGQTSLETHIQILAEWNSQKEGLESELARQIPEINLEQKLRAIDRDVVAMALPEDSALIEFVRFDVFDFKAVPARGEAQWKPAHYLAFILPAGKPDDLQMIDLGEAEGIDRMIATFRAAVTGEKEGRGIRDLGAIPHEAEGELFVEQGKLLRNAVFDKLLDGIGKHKQLFIAPDGDLTRLPFEILPTDDGGYLIDKYRISYLGVGRDLIRFGAASSGKPTAPMVAADPDFNLTNQSLPKQHQEEQSRSKISRDFERGKLHFTPLPGTRIEGESIAKRLGVEPLLDGNALESRLKACQSPRILHIATHGFFLQDQQRDLNKEQRDLGMIDFGEKFGMGRFSSSNMENPLLRSGLALAGVNTWLKEGSLPEEAEDGILTAEDVTGLDLLATELVVLSACETGIGEVRIGEGVFGLRRAFVLAGAKTLVMSLWKVPDKQTQELMEIFYQKILNGQPRSEALREAQLEIRKKNPHPLFWGAFICQGDPNKLDWKK